MSILLLQYVFRSIWFSFSILGRQRKVHDFMGGEVIVKRLHEKKGTFLSTSFPWRRNNLTFSAAVKNIEKRRRDLAKKFHQD
jgi:hypothetical protein